MRSLERFYAKMTLRPGLAPRLKIQGTKELEENHELQSTSSKFGADGSPVAVFFGRDRGPV
jgi:hypothetical protein